MNILTTWYEETPTANNNNTYIRIKQALYTDADKMSNTL